MQQNLLLVDDEPNIPRALKRALRGESYSVHVANSGQQAIELMQAQHFDVVVSDYRMPGMNGAEFLSKVRDKHPKTIRLMLSGQADIDAVINAVNSGNIYKFLTKPWSNERIRDELRGAFELANVASIDKATGWLAAGAFQDALEAELSVQQLRVVVGDIRNFASVRSVVEEANFIQIAEAITTRCGDVAVAHGSIERGLFAFATPVDGADRRLDQIAKALQEPLDVADSTLSLDIVLGCVDAGEDVGAEEAIHSAAVAVSLLEVDCPPRYSLYTKELESNLHLRHSLEHDMRRALENKEFFVLVQPQVDPLTLKISGGEVLVRWQHPRRGLISPLQFIDLAERTGFIHELGHWVMEQAIAVAREITTLRIENLRVSMNVSPRQFLHGFDAPWVDLLRTTSIHDSDVLNHLEIEITESTVMDDPVAGAALLEYLSALGPSIALDDFGTGHSSLSQLNALPINILKIDRSLIADVEHNQRSQTMAKHLISMAKELGFKVIAEGLEDEGQLRFCRACGCDALQGFAFYKPMQVEDFLMHVIEEQLTTH